MLGGVEGVCEAGIRRNEAGLDAIRQRQLEAVVNRSVDSDSEPSGIARAVLAAPTRSAMRPSG